MYDKSLVMDGLLNIEESLVHVLERTASIKSVNDFLTTPAGVDMLDVAAMRLLAVGEEIRRIDKRTGGELLPKYPDIEKKSIISMRNFIAHDYFHIDAKVVFYTLQNNVRPLLATVRQMIADLDRADVL